MLQAGLIALAQLAMVRTAILMGTGLGTWLLYALIMGVSFGWFHLPLAAWYMAGIAFLLTCWILGKGLGRIGLWMRIRLLFFLVTSLLIDFFHKEGLILNTCFWVKGWPSQGIVPCIRPSESTLSRPASCLPSFIGI
jgi:hypothetical protein